MQIRDCASITNALAPRTYLGRWPSSRHESFSCWSGARLLAAELSSRPFFKRLASDRVLQKFRHRLERVIKAGPGELAPRELDLSLLVLDHIYAYRFLRRFPARSRLLSVRLI